MGHSASRKKGKSTTSKRDCVRGLPQVSLSPTRGLTSASSSKTPILTSGKNLTDSSGARNRPAISSNPSSLSLSDITKMFESVNPGGMTTMLKSVPARPYPTLNIPRATNNASPSVEPYSQTAFNRRVLGVDLARKDNGFAVLDLVDKYTYGNLMAAYNRTDVKLTKQLYGRDRDTVHGWTAHHWDGDLRDLVETMRLTHGSYGYEYTGRQAFEANFIWGPNGEWTSLPTPPDARRRGYAPEHAIAIPHNRSSRTQLTLRRLPGDGLAFDSYQDWAEYTDTFGKFAPYLLELGALWGKLGLASEYTERWLSALKGGRWKLACGVLHAADNAFDPFGLLAHINGAKWEWDDDEAAYAYLGVEGTPKSSVFELPLAAICEFLDLDYRVSRQSLGRFVTLITTLADQSERLDQVADDIARALGLYAGIKKRTEEAISHLSPDYNRDPYRVLDEYKRSDLSALEHRVSTTYPVSIIS